MFVRMGEEGQPAVQPGGQAASTAEAAPDCGDDPIATLKHVFLKVLMETRIAQGQDPALRPVFVKPHGVARGTFTMVPDLPHELRVGVFGHRSFPAWVRFSGDTLPTNPDFNKAQGTGRTLGIGIKLFGVPGTKVLEPEVNASTHDFLLENYDLFFVDNVQEFCEFIYAGFVEGDFGKYLKDHQETQEILNELHKPVPSVLQTSYWSALPFAFGSERYVKYKVVPRQVPDVGPGPAITNDDPNFLHADLRRRLLNGAAELDFYVQLRTGKMPLDAAMTRWEESESKPIHVATLHLPQQDVDARGQAAYGEHLAFNTWHALPEHMPVGSIAQARRVVYQAAAEFRRNVNGIPVGEPAEPRPLLFEPAPRDEKIVRAAIHPAIGIARVGNSKTEYFIGPEVPDPLPEPPGFYKDKKGALKRQAALFRVYGYNAAGEVVSELTADKADINWTVHVANTKGAWYQFQIALDIPEAPSAHQTQLRNQDVTDRTQLVIDPGPRSIKGTNVSGDKYAFNSGKFLGDTVYLGELRTDEQGRLIFLGGKGESASPSGGSITTFANNDGWYDDVSDGPVTATVSIGGREVPVEGAWVVVAPPNYGTNVVDVRTMYDLLNDVNIATGWTPLPKTVSFKDDIYPILARFCNLQWVNQGFAVQFGWGGPNNFTDPEYVKQLAGTGAEYAELRQQIYNSMRVLNRDGESPVPWPWIYGDAMNIPPVSPRQYMALSPTQMYMLEQWVNGKFEADWGTGSEPPHSLDQVPLEQQPATLDQAALHFCLADAFHPGCEMTWPVRHFTMYSAPFRIKHRPAGEPVPDYGLVLLPEVATGPTGPLYAQGPGDISRWMAIPWQADTASCRSAYTDSAYGSNYDPYVPTFWPARVPNHVLTEINYEIVMDETRPREERIAAFRERASWFRVLKGDSLAQKNQMVRDFGKMGVVEVREGIPNDPDFPPFIFVESRPGFDVEEIAPRRNLVMMHTPGGAEGAPRAAADAAIEASGRPHEEVVTGYHDEVHRFVRRPFVLVPTRPDLEE
ncbi:MAG TPA: LodA/GoxA family CTQ-dependent oxidase [Chloroflexia bacterium]|nr:LodA/GoxA family CTQ-dependent oxidase [Chloroflexia bacterium]